jgi:hypothetical protein
VSVQICYLVICRLVCMMQGINVILVVLCYLHRFTVSNFSYFFFNSKRILDNDDDVSETLKKKRQKLQQAPNFGNFSGW